MKVKGKKKKETIPYMKRSPSYSNYWVSRDGKVFREKLNGLYLLKIRYSPKGYPVVFIQDNNKKHLRKIHRLVAEAYIPNPNNYQVVMHLDNNPQNNTIENLKWGTQSDNMQQMVRDGRQRKSKIIQYLPKVRILFNKGFSAKEIEISLGLSKTSTRRLIKRIKDDKR